MLADAGAAGYYRDVDQIQIPEAAQFRFPLNGDIEGRSQLDGPEHSRWRWRLICGIDRVGYVFRPLDFGTQKVKERIGFAVDAAGQLNLLDHLIGRVIQLLFRGDDAEQVNDESQQNHSDKDEYHSGEVVGIAPLVLQSFAGSLQESMNMNHHLY